MLVHTPDLPLAKGFGLAALTPYGSHRAKELPKSRELTVLSRTDMGRGVLSGGGR